MRDDEICIVYVYILGNDHDVTMVHLSLGTIQRRDGGGGGDDVVGPLVGAGQGGVPDDRVLWPPLDPAKYILVGAELGGEPVWSAPCHLLGQQSCQGSCQEEGPQEGASDELPRVDGVGQELRGQVHCGEPV